MHELQPDTIRTPSRRVDVARCRLHRHFVIGTDMNLISLSLLEVRQGLASRSFSAQEYCEHLVAHIANHDGLGAWAERDPERLLIDAREVDRLGWAGDDDRPLAGVPIALKDNIDAVGYACTAGTGALQSRRPATNAAVVDALLQAGALVAGKTRMHELAMGITSNNAVSGPARNPYDPERSPGGSSGGSGTAVGARMAPAALGTDTGGSVRVPAALCGLVGLRPTIGRYSGAGIVPLCRTRDTAGPMARTMADVELLDAVLADDDRSLEVALGDLRVGVPRATLASDLEPGVAKRFEEALQLMSRLGVSLVETDLPERDAINAATGFPLVLFELERDLPAFLRQEGIHLSLADIRAGIGSPDVAAIVAQQLGPDAVTSALHATALQRRARLQGLYAEHFRRHRLDAIVAPTCPLTAPLLGDGETVVLNGRNVPTFLTYIRATDPGSVAGLPGLSIPMGLSDGLPVGLHLEGAPHADKFLLAFGRALARELPDTPPPRFLTAAG